jgi:hypothetical protein
MSESNYSRYRGKCKEMSEALVAENPVLRLVRGHYWEPMWNRDEPHWWCVNPDGEIIDPTRLQFPSGGIAEFYTEFDGTCECANCGKEFNEQDGRFDSNYAFCSSSCNMRFVGL